MKKFASLLFVAALLCVISLPLRAGMDPTKTSFSSKEMDLRTNLRYLFSQYLTWERIAASQTINNSQDAAKAQARFVSSQNDICNLFKSYFGDYNGGQVTDVFKQYSQLITDYVNATKSMGDKALTINRMHDKADEFANVLNMSNMSWSKDEISAALKKFSDNLVSEIDLQGSNPGSVDTAMMDATYSQMMDMADTFTTGIIKQDPSKFW